ncbi:MAG: DUF86 domain-containing protein [Rhodospirillaceae bacterium]|nr:DUF86 domain-containing protein [Rhodospirillaceae bacterium]
MYSLLKITEAVGNLPDELTSDRPDISWRDIARFGNLLRHQYFRIDTSTVDDIVANDLPALKAATEAFWRRLDLGDLPTFD